MSGNNREMSWSTYLSEYLDILKIKIKDTVIKYDLQNAVAPLLWCFETYPVLSVVACCVAFAYAIPICIFLMFALITTLISFIGFLFVEGIVLSVGFALLLSVLAALTVFCGIALFAFWLLYMTVLLICQALKISENGHIPTSEEFLNNLPQQPSFGVDEE